MQMQILTRLPFKNRSNPATGQTQPGSSSEFFHAHPVGEIVRGLFLSSVLWVLLAVGVYSVYTMILGSH